MILTKLEKQAIKIQSLHVKVLHNPNFLTGFLFRRSIDTYNKLIKAGVN